MFDTATVTIAGNVVADPKITGLPDNPERVNFRVVSTRRRRDQATGQWVDAGEYGANVVCWRTLARGVAQSLRRGDPVLVTGRISERPYQGEDGARHYFTEVTADFVGHDLAKGTARFYRFSRLNRLEDPAEPGGQADEGGQPDGGDEVDEVADAPDESSESPAPAFSLA
jgi:single-strand DNA-binding protein